MKIGTSGSSGDDESTRGEKRPSPSKVNSSSVKRNKVSTDGDLEDIELDENVASLKRSFDEFEREMDAAVNPLLQQASANVRDDYPIGDATANLGMFPTFENDDGEENDSESSL